MDPDATYVQDFDAALADAMVEDDEQHGENIQAPPSPLASLLDCLRGFKPSVQSGILAAYAACHPPARDAITHYDYLLGHLLPHFFAEFGNIETHVAHTHTWVSTQLTDLEVSPPTVPDAPLRGRIGSGPLSYREARIRKLTWAADVTYVVKWTVYGAVSATAAAGGTVPPPPLAAVSVPRSSSMRPDPPEGCIWEALATHVSPRWRLCGIPLMVGSRLALAAAPDACPTEFGTFCVGGVTKVWNTSRVQRNNRPIITRKAGSGRGASASSGVQLVIRSLSDERARSSSTLLAKLASPSSPIMVAVPMLDGGAKHDKMLPLPAVLRLQGFESRQEIDALIWRGAPKHPDAARVWDASWAHPLCSLPLPELVQRAAEGLTDWEGRSGMGDGFDSDRRTRAVAQMMANESLPHCGFDASPATIAHKGLCYGAYAARMIDVLLGGAPADEQWAEQNCVLETIAVGLARCLRQLVRSFALALHNRVYGAISSCGGGIAAASIDVGALAGEYPKVNKTMATIFSTGQVTVTKNASAHGSVIQPCEQLNTLSTAAHLRHVMSSANKKAREEDARAVHMSQRGALCCAATPEGDAAGLTLQMGLMASARLGTEAAVLEAAVLYVLQARLPEGVHVRRIATAGDAVCQNGDAEEAPLLVLVNGCPVCSVRGDDASGSAAFAALRSGRADCLLPPQAGITRTPYGLAVWGDIGVIVFPLLRLDRANRVLSRNGLSGDFVTMAAAWGPRAAAGGSLHAWGTELTQSSSATFPPRLWDALQHSGALEWVEAEEAASLRIADDAWDVIDDVHYRQRLGYRLTPFTHVALHPTALSMGITVAAAPWTDRTQAARVAFTSAQGVQQVGAPTLDAWMRPDASFHPNGALLLWHGQRPLVETDASRAWGLQVQPTGANLIVAFAAFEGCTQEDSIVVNRASIDRGALRVTQRRSFTYACSISGKGGSTSGGGSAGLRREVFEHPCFGEPPVARLRGDSAGGGAIYGALGADGLPLLGVRLRDGDVIVGKTAHYVIGSEVVRRADVSFLFCAAAGEEWVVESVARCDGRDGRPSVVIVAHCDRVPECGDKLSDGAAQKGTIGWIAGQEDMPFIASGPCAGMTPDLLVSLTSINSRVTMNKVTEHGCAMWGAIAGKFVDATPFRRLPYDELVDDLRKRGYSETATVACGKTGAILGDVQFALCFYSALRHYAAGKAYACDWGPTTALTHQPTDGRANHGALKTGEMDAVNLGICHGASTCTDDRLRVASDPAVTHVCGRCGCVGNVEFGGIVARACGTAPPRPRCMLCHSDDVRTLATTYTFGRVLVGALAAMDVGVGIETARAAVATDDAATT